MSKLNKNDSGFTVVEFLLLIVILALVILLGVYVLNKHRDSSYKIPNPPSKLAQTTNTGLRIDLRSCSSVTSSTPPSCDSTELDHLLSLLNVSKDRVVFVSTCYGNPPLNYEDIQARSLVVGPFETPISQALSIAKNDTDVESVSTISLPYNNPSCNIP